MVPFGVLRAPISQSYVYAQMVLTAPFWRLSRHWSMPSSIQACGFIWIATKFFRLFTVRRSACGDAATVYGALDLYAATAIQICKKVLRGTASSMIYTHITRKNGCLAGCGKTEVRQPISHDRSRRISGLRREMGVRPRFFRNLLEGQL